MANINDSCKFILDVIDDVKMPKYLFSAPETEQDNHVVVGYLPQARGDLLSTNVINVNVYTNKIEGKHNSTLLFGTYETIRNRLESFTGTSTRVKHYQIDIYSEPFLGDLEGTNFSLLNIRVTLTNDNNKILIN
jgi:hypothetical protein